MPGGAELGPVAVMDETPAQRALGPDQSIRYELGAAESAAAAAVARLDAEDAARRLWERDPTFFARAPEPRSLLRGRLGWLDLPERMAGELEELRRFAEEIRSAGFRQALVLGMGGSVLAAQALTMTFQAAAGFLAVTVLDSTDPEAVLAADRAHEPARTLYVVASKSGSTVETRCLAAYFHERARQALGGEAGRRFVAVTDAGSPLEADARARGFRRVFLTPPDVGGRYSALTFFGLLPAALAGIEVGALLDGGRRMASGCAASVPARDNSGVRLGATLAALAAAGRDKVTFVLTPEIAALGPWLEQVLAESTGKDGRGLVPVLGEPLAPPDRYGADRAFVYLRLGEAAPAPLDGPVAALARAGFPVVRIGLPGKRDLGAELFRWQLAGTVAARELQVDPFDEPFVEEVKQAARERLAAPGAVPAAAEPAGESVLVNGEILALLDGLAPGSYLALCPFFQLTPRRRAALARLRAAVRDRRRVATTADAGPRFMHSSGQLHKGGPATMAVLQLTAGAAEDAPVPGANVSFGGLTAALAAADRAVLASHRRRVVRVHFGASRDGELETLAGLVETRLQ